jgi:Concanavalin A-like lectin/glucanases superfamily
MFYPSPRKISHLALLLFVVATKPPAASTVSPEPGLLFYLSGNNGLTADYAQGNPKPSVASGVEIISDGALGPGFRCSHFDQVFGYWAPGNIYAERGTLAFSWRARDPIGKTPFHIFQVSYCDHSSIDFYWLRIDFNGEGYDAFVTDANLARARVSYKAPLLPKPDQWVHFAVEWDETQGMRFFVDGKLVGKVDMAAVFDAGLDQFGPHGEVIGPQEVYTGYQYVRGGDIDEIRIYDQMLTPDDVDRVTKGGPANETKAVLRDLRNKKNQDEWWLRYGWNRPGDIPPYLAESSVKVRKVEIHDVFDLKQWFWKANDGIRETTWPGVYNQSRLPGRSDYFIEPDWNCSTLSGKSVTFSMPDEPWNHLEIAGNAYGSVSLLTFDKEKQAYKESLLFKRPADQERTFHRLMEPARGGKVRFDNSVQETPIGEFSAYFVSPGTAPPGTTRLSYTITGKALADNSSLEPLLNYINGRYMADERSVMVALPAGAPHTPGTSTIENALPLVHVLIPFEFRADMRPAPRSDTHNVSHVSEYSYTWENMDGGLDGIALDLPALKVKPTHGEYFPLNIQVKDPLWPNRNLLDFSFAVRPGEAKTLWLDTRDRILPNGYSFYMMIAGAGSDFGPASLEGAQVHLIFKDRKAAAVEHEMDRFTQVKDNVGNFVEWGTNNKKLKLYDRYSRDITDLLRVNPGHLPARHYWSYLNPEQGWPEFEQPKAPPDIPLWAFRQVEDLKLLKRFINWWIDERQMENGELGGGLSDDGDLTNLWPGAALMGIEPEKITRSVHILMDAYYKHGMFTNGLATIMADQLHSYEEGISVLPQTMALEYGDPKVVERIMATSKAVERLTGVDKLGHRHIRSSYYSGTKISEDSIWARSITNNWSYLILHPAIVLVEFNGHPVIKKWLLEIADGLLAHRKNDGHGNYYLPGEIFFPSGEDRGRGYGPDVANLLWAAWRWTGDQKYLTPIFDSINQGDYEVLSHLNGNVIDLLGKRETWGKAITSLVSPQTRSDFYRHVAWQVTGNKEFLENYYANQIQAGAQHMAMFTEDHWWVDRVGVASTELQRSRLGGVAAHRGQTYPGQAISWKFAGPASGDSVAILVPEVTTSALKIVAFNLESVPVKAMMTAWDLDPGSWEMTMGIDSDGDDIADKITESRTLELERTGDIEFHFEAKVSTVIQLKLKSKSIPLWNRPDLAISRDDVRVQGNVITVTVHSLGSVHSPASSIALQDAVGKTLATAAIPVIEAPLDLIPRTAEVAIRAPRDLSLSGFSVLIDPEKRLKEITAQNNRVVIP